MGLIIGVRAVCLVGFFLTGSCLWTWLIWWPIILAFNSEDFEKVYEEYWEIRIKRKLTLTEAAYKISNLFADRAIEWLENKGRKK